ncbi:MAG: hypothetical protein V4612_06790 [Pseudomonadota bacterium]
MKDSLNQNYVWETTGDESNPIVAFIAPSNLLPQWIIKKRIESLVDQDFCVKYPKYDQHLLAPETLPERPKSGQERFGDGVQSPAVSAQDGARQFIECVENGWNIMPLMGGNNFEQKISLISQYFQQHPDKKNPQVKCFGFSNSTFAAFLQAEGICRFVATPFTSAIARFDEGNEKYQEPAEELIKIMKGQDAQLVSYPRPILFDQHQEITQTNHYILNVGPICCDIGDSEYKDLNLELNIPQEQEWSFAFEGFVEVSNGSRLLNYRWLIKEFLSKHQENLPQFIEIGNISTRLDGKDGYQNLFHDIDGLIELSDDNISAILSSEQQLRKYIKAILQIQETKNIPIEKRTKFPQSVLDKVNQGAALDAQDVKEIIEQENQLIKKVREEIIEVAQGCGIGVILNNRYGHTANMSVVNGGFNVVVMRKDDQLTMTMLEPELTTHTSPRKNNSLQNQQLETSK